MARQLPIHEVGGKSLYEGECRGNAAVATRALHDSSLHIRHMILTYHLQERLQ
ncbi:MAG TPA: hypothetical protein VEL31_09115 [Ktedonobacteraceae bacterium]|jgi:hypothetical protein|nr:hypothetical protein [Ktedonobacteraceae bacterium]